MPGEVKLKPCPFCGREPVVSRDAPFFSVLCSCGNMSRNSLESAIAVWNRRTPDPRASDELFWKAIKASYEEGIEKGRESVKTEPGASVIRWTRYDGTPETLPNRDIGRSLLCIINNDKNRTVVLFNFKNYEVPRWSALFWSYLKDVDIGDLWAYIPDPPEGME